MKTAKDIMTPNPKYISSGEELYKTTELFFENNIHYAPIMTPNKEVLGLLSEMGLVKAALKRYLEPDSHEKVIHHKELFETAYFVEEADSLDQVIKAMTKSESRRVLVRNKLGYLVGIISPKDILRLVSGQQVKTTNLRYELDKSKQEAQELTAKLQAFEHSLKLYRNVFEDSPYMMHSVNKEGVIIMANRRIHESLGYDKDELLGKKLSDLYPKTVVHEAVQGLSTIMATIR
jgi:predicted transcriptional regulator